MAQLGQKPHGFKDLDFLTVLKKTAVTFGADWKSVASQRNDRPHRRRRHPDWLMWRRMSGTPHHCCAIQYTTTLALTTLCGYERKLTVIRRTSR
jgi:hypothetical protein